MANYQKELVVPYTPKQMFDLIVDVKSYPDFLPGCVNSIEHAKSDVMQDASLEINMGLLTSSFSTINSLEEPNSITMKLKSGIFSSLTGKWEFFEVNDGCKVSIILNYKFNLGPLSFIGNKLVESAASMVVDAFINRAKSVYSI